MQARELLNEAISFEPDYYHFYRHYAEYLLPRWYGEKGDVQDFAEEISGRSAPPNDSIVYFQIMSSLACYCRGDLEELPRAAYPKLRDGYLNLTRLYGPSNVTANRFAEMAYVFQDKFAAREAFANVVGRDTSVWITQETFDAARSWADAP